MGVLADRRIRELSLNPETYMINPFSERVDGPRVVSYGLQPAGYDARLGPKIKVIDWTQICAEALDPLAPKEDFYFPQSADPFFLLPPHACMVGETVEFFSVPRNCVVRGAAKTTYTRVGINFDVASIHPGWRGHLKLHISNTTSVPVKIYGGMGIVYLEFHEIDGEVERDYSELKAPSFQSRD